MKKLLKGFTLAEVLITLTIIGVISAIALPSINSSTTSAQIGPQVGKALSTLENANQMWLSQNNARRLGSDCLENATGYFLCIRSVVNGNMVDSNEALQFADGIKLYPTGGVAVPDGFGPAVSMMVDINGNARPNRNGRDRFAFYVRRNGDVVPYGGVEHARLAGMNQALWGQNCSNIDQYSAAGADQLSCTGSIVDNNMKALYLDSGRGADSSNATIGIKKTPDSLKPLNPQNPPLATPNNNNNNNNNQLLQQPSSPTLP